MNINPRDLSLQGPDGMQLAELLRKIHTGGEAVVVTGTDPVEASLAPEVLYDFGNASAIDITLIAPTDNENAHYHFVFYSGVTPTTLDVGDVVMPDDFEVEANTRYEVDILDGYGVVASWTLS